MNEIENGELVAAIREIQDRVRARHPDGEVPGSGIPLADLLPLLHARDAAEAKVAAIGTVNPRRGGVANAVIQSVKRRVSRALDWHVREQVEFNRAVMASLQATLDALNEQNRALAQLANHTHSQMEALRAQVADQGRKIEEQLTLDASGIDDLRLHWQEWRTGWEEKINRSEVYLLRSISELSTSYQHRLTQTEGGFRQSVREQHTNYQAALDRAAREIQEKLWADLARTRTEMEHAGAARQSEIERVIHTELGLIRKRSAIATAPAASAPGAVAVPPAPSDAIDWLRFAERFRGTEEFVRARQKPYVDRFLASGVRGTILDIGCGRGEFLEEASKAGLRAAGVELSTELVHLCRAKGLEAECVDAFDYLKGLEVASLAGIYCSQVIEHLDPLRLPELIQLASSKLQRGAWMIFETPNPECLAIFATHFYVDPSHTRPVPPVLMHFYLEEAGLGAIEIHRLAPADEAVPALRELPQALRESLFGGLDYSIAGRKL